MHLLKNKVRMSGQMDRLVRVRPRKKIIQISHTCRAGDSVANPQRNQCAPRMLQTADQLDQSTGQTRPRAVDLKLRNLTNYNLR